MGEQCHADSEKGNPLRGMTQTHISMDLKEKQVETWLKIFPSPGHSTCSALCVGDPMETGTQTAPALLPQARRSLLLQPGFFRQIQTWP